MRRPESRGSAEGEAAAAAAIESAKRRVAWVRPSIASISSSRPPRRSASVRATRSPVPSPARAGPEARPARPPFRSLVTRKTISPCSIPAAKATVPPGAEFERPGDQILEHPRQRHRLEVQARRQAGVHLDAEGDAGLASGAGEAMAQVGDQPIGIGLGRGLGGPGVAERLRDQPFQGVGGGDDALDLRPHRLIDLGPGELPDGADDAGEGAADVVPEHRHLALVAHDGPDRVALERRIEDAHDFLARGAGLRRLGWTLINLWLKSSGEFQPTLQETIGIGKRHSTAPLRGEPTENAVPEPGHVARGLDDIVKEIRGLRRPERDEERAGEARRAAATSAEPRRRWCCRRARRRPAPGRRRDTKTTRSERSAAW